MSELFTNLMSARKRNPTRSENVQDRRPTARRRVPAPVRESTGPRGDDIGRHPRLTASAQAVTSAFERFRSTVSDRDDDVVVPTPTAAAAVDDDTCPTNAPRGRRRAIRQTMSTSARLIAGRRAIVVVVVGRRCSVATGQRGEVAVPRRVDAGRVPRIAAAAPAAAAAAARRIR